MERALRDAAHPLRLALDDADGEHLSATAVTVAVTDSAGVAVAGSPFTAVQDDARTWVWETSLPAASAGVLDVYDVVWTATIGATTERRRTQIEIVSGFLFELAALREALGVDQARVPGWMLRRARDAAEDLFEHQTRPSFRRRGRRITLDGPGGPLLPVPDLYPRRLVSATIDGTALSAGQLAEVAPYEWGAFDWEEGTWTAGRRNLNVFYEHGYDQVPEHIERAALTLAKSYLQPASAPANATSETTGEGITFRLVVASPDAPAGIPAVDAVLSQYPADIFAA